MIAFLPLLLLILLIIGIAFVLSRMQLGRFGYWLLGGYVIFLLAGVIGYSFIPTDDVVDEGNLEDIANENVFLYQQVIDRGVSLEAFDEYKKIEWEFKPESSESVTLYNSAGYHYHYPVIVKKVEGQDTIQVSLYEVEPDIELELVENYSDDARVYYTTSGVINIEPPGMRLYRFSQVSEEFPFNHFDNEIGPHWVYPDLFYHETVFYVTIPAHIELHASPDMEVYNLN